MPKLILACSPKHKELGTSKLQFWRRYRRWNKELHQRVFNPNQDQNYIAERQS